MTYIISFIRRWAADFNEAMALVDANEARALLGEF